MYNINRNNITKKIPSDTQNRFSMNKPKVPFNYLCTNLGALSYRAKTKKIKELVKEIIEKNSNISFRFRLR